MAYVAGNYTVHNTGGTSNFTPYGKSSITQYTALNHPLRCAMGTGKSALFCYPAPRNESYGPVFDYEQYLTKQEGFSWTHTTHTQTQRRCLKRYESAEESFTSSSQFNATVSRCQNRPFKATGRNSAP